MGKTLFIVDENVDKKNMKKLFKRRQSLLQAINSPGFAVEDSTEESITTELSVMISNSSEVVIITSVEKILFSPFYRFLMEHLKLIGHTYQLHAI